MSEEKRSPGLGVGLMLVCAVLWSTAGLFIKACRGIPWCLQAGVVLLQR